MKQINFKQINVETSIGVFEPKDIAKEIGEVLHKRAANLAMDELARRIFNSEADIMIEDADFAEMMSLLDGIILFMVIQAIADNAKEVKQKEEKEV